MGTYVNGIYQPAIGEVGWGTLVAADLSRFSELAYNVKSGASGAVGNGVTNDSAAFQAAVDAVSAAGGGMVFVPPGTYMLSTPVTIKTGVTLRGSGIDVTILKSNANNQNVVVFNSTSAAMSLQDLTVNGNRTTYAAGTAAAIKCAGFSADILVRRVKTIDCQGRGLFWDNTVVGGYTNVWVENCEFTDAGQGFDVCGGGFMTHYYVRNNLFYNTSGQGLADTVTNGSMILEGNVFEGPMGNGLSMEPCDNMLVRGNQFHNLNDGAIAIKLTPKSQQPGEDPSNIVIQGNHIYNTGTVPSTYCDHGIVADNVSNLVIANNLISRMGRAAIRLRVQGGITGSANVLRNVLVTGNTVVDSNQDNVSNNAALAIENNAPGTVEKVKVIGNKLINQNTDGHTSHGIREVGAVNDSEYSDNDLRGFATAAYAAGSGTGVELRDNRGHNPQGTASITVTSSPFTYTAGSTPEMVYIRAGTVSDVSKNSRTIFTATGCTVRLEPAQAVVVTYSSAPTMEKDRL